MSKTFSDLTTEKSIAERAAIGVIRAAPIMMPEDILPSVYKTIAEVEEIVAQLSTTNVAYQKAIEGILKFVHPDIKQIVSANMLARKIRAEIQVNIAGLQRLLNEGNLVQMHIEIVSEAEKQRRDAMSNKGFEVVGDAVNATPTPPVPATPDKSSSEDKNATKEQEDDIE